MKFILFSLKKLKVLERRDTFSTVKLYMNFITQILFIINGNAKKSLIFINVCGTCSGMVFIVASFNNIRNVLL